MGQTIGVAIFGVVFNLNISRYLSRVGIKGINVNSLYGAKSINLGIGLDKVKASLNFGIHSLFIVLIVISIICAIMAMMMENSLKKD